MPLNSHLRDSVLRTTARSGCKSWAVQVDHVVEIARALAFGQGTHLLGKHFLKGVTQDVDTIFRQVAVRVVNRPLHGREDEHLVDRQVQLDAWRVAGTAQRTTISQTPLCRLAAAPIGEDFELARLGRKLQAAGVVNPITDFLENLGEESLIKMIGILQREVQIFGEAVGFEVALLQAGATLEDPPVADRRVCRDAGKEPAERIVFFDDMRLELKLGGESHDLLLRDHRLVSLSSVADTQTRHVVIRRSDGSAGSSLA